MIINMVGGEGGFAPSNAIVGVTAYAGSTVTISNGTVTKVVTPDKSHVLSDLSSFAIYYFGIPSSMFSPSVTWNIIATYQSEQTTATIIVNTNAFYDVVLNYRIPYDYQEVEYLESNGNQYIDTLIKTDNIKVFNAQITTVSGSHYDRSFWAFGGSSGTKEESYQAYNGFGLVLGTNNYPSLVIGQDYFSFPQYDFGYTGNFSLSLSIDNNFTYSFAPVSDTPYQYGGTSSPISYNGNMYLFTMHYGDGVYLNNTCTNRFHSCEIFNWQNQKVADFIPCYRKLDSVAGMYDSVNKRFLTNQGTGTFVVGSDVIS